MSLPIPGNLAQNTRSQADAALNASQAGGPGYAGSVFTNIATGGSRLSASQDATSGPATPAWLWLALAAAAVWFVWRKG